MSRAALNSKKQTEAALHQEVWRYLRHALPPEVRAFHPANGGLRDAATAGQLRAMGVVPGIPDLVFILPNAQIACIELKVGRNKLTDEQAEFFEWMQARGSACTVCRSVDEVEATITRWLAAFQMKPRATLVQRRAA